MLHHRSQAELFIRVSWPSADVLLGVFHHAGVHESLGSKASVLYSRAAACLREVHIPGTVPRARKQGFPTPDTEDLLQAGQALANGSRERKRWLLQVHCEHEALRRHVSKWFMVEASLSEQDVRKRYISSGQDPFLSVCAAATAKSAPLAGQLQWIGSGASRGSFSFKP